MSDIPEDILIAARAHIAQGEMAIITVVNAILVERERCAKIAEGIGRDASRDRDIFVMAGFAGLSRVIASAIRIPHSLPETPSQAAKPHGVPPPTPCGTPNPAGEP